QNIALEAAREAIVLLKNEHELLPLKKSIRSIAVIGPNADEPRTQLGDYVPTVVPQHVTTVLEGIRRMVPASTVVTYVRGCEVIGPGENRIEEAKKAAADAEVAVVVVGENERRAPRRTATDGEGYDSATLELTGLQEELVEAVQSTGTPTIVVLINGRALATRWIAQHASAVLEAWLPGEKGGQAVAEILFGDVNPSGRLPVTIPRHAGQLPVYYNAKRSKPHWVNSGWGHPYVDLEPTPLYPFGFGLSYTRFAFSNLHLSRHQILASDSVEVTVDVKNAGARAGAEVVQLYVQDVVSSVSTPVKELRRFAKVSLGPGESQTCKFTLEPDDLALFDKDLRRVVEPGEFRVMIGDSSENILLQQTLVVAQEAKRL
ncbi:MAG TPA: glycoside hydrolase family 3 C-terminal domain-containing protein, partial [Verrucomicrobiae bacterium]|nr:glycoside hydrolase family 3 C-terminal domain-containing protein [Verrucomicrobiae bacterium]